MRWTPPTPEKIMKQNWFFEKINKIDKPLTRFIKKQKGPKYIKSERVEVIADTTEIQGIIREY